MIGKLSVGDQIGTTLFRIRNITDYKAYINSIDEGCDAEDSILIDIFLKSTLPSLI